MKAGNSTRPVPIPHDELRDLLLAYRRENWNGIQTEEIQEQVVDAMLRTDAETLLKQISQFWDLPTNGSVLDIRNL